MCNNIENFTQDEIVYLTNMMERREHVKTHSKQASALRSLVIKLPELKEEIDTNPLKLYSAKLQEHPLTLLQKLYIQYAAPQEAAHLVVNHHETPTQECWDSIITNLTSTFNRPVKVEQYTDTDLNFLSVCEVYNITIGDVELSMTVVLGECEMVFDGMLAELVTYNVPKITAGIKPPSNATVIFAPPQSEDITSTKKITPFGFFQGPVVTCQHIDDVLTPILEPSQKTYGCGGFWLDDRYDHNVYNVFKQGERWLVIDPTDTKLLEYPIFVSYISNPNNTQFEVEKSLGVPLALGFGNISDIIDSYDIRMDLYKRGWTTEAIHNRIEQVKLGIVRLITGKDNCDYLMKSIVCTVLYTNNTQGDKQKEYIDIPEHGLKLVFTGPTYLNFENIKL